MSENTELIDTTAPPEEARVADYRVMPWPDGTRITVEMSLTPFRQFPALDVMVATPEGEVLRSISLVGAMERRPAPTLHLPRLDRGAPLVVLIEMLRGDVVTQRLEIPCAVAGPIIRGMGSEHHGG